MHFSHNFQVSHKLETEDKVESAKNKQTNKQTKNMSVGVNVTNVCANFPGVLHIG